MNEKQARSALDDIIALLNRNPAHAQGAELVRRFVEQVVEFVGEHVGFEFADRGLRRAEAAKLQLRDFQQCDSHWAVVDLIGKGPLREPDGIDLGCRHHGEGYLAHREGVREKGLASNNWPPRLSPLGARLCHAAGGELE